MTRSIRHDDRARARDQHQGRSPVPAAASGRSASRRLLSTLLVVPAIAWMGPRQAIAQVSAEDFAALRQKGIAEGWTFSVGPNAATGRGLDELCGLVEPKDWQDRASFDPCTPKLALPRTFDWRALGGCTPVKDQGSCGSCWAFATVGPLECNILIKDGVTVDLSEQWLVSCNREGWGCDGGWWAHDYHEWKTGATGGTGAVRESDLPYVGYEASCDGPYSHAFLLDGWEYIGSKHSTPTVEAIKQAIMDYGPVTVAVYVDSVFQSYAGGVFNASADGSVNHGVLLVGWDDDQGSNGVWFMRNSWGTDWGEDGYMRIEYNCSKIGYSACYVDYPGQDVEPGLTVSPATEFTSEGTSGGPFTPERQVYTLENKGDTGIDYDVTHNASWISLTNGSGHLDGHGTTTVTVSINVGADSLSAGIYEDTIRFINATNQVGDTTRSVNLNVRAGDDAFEQNDSPEQAKPIQPSTYDLQGLDDDWFHFVVARRSQLSVRIQGPEGDLDLGVYDAQGTLIGASVGAATSNEHVEDTVEGGDLFLLVTPFEGRTSSYMLTVGLSPVANPPPTVKSTSPWDGSIRYVVHDITIDFSEPIEASSVITILDVEILHDGEKAYGGSFTWSNNNQRLTWTSSSQLAPGSYSVWLEGTDLFGFRDVDGNALDGDNDGEAGGDFTASFKINGPADDIDPWPCDPGFCGTCPPLPLLAMVAGVSGIGAMHRRRRGR